MANKLLPVYPSRAETHAMMDACEHERDRMLIMLCYATGGRISEVLGTRVGDITRNGLRMPSLKQRVSAQKHVFLPPTFLAELRAYCKGKGTTDPIISTLHDPSRPIHRTMGWRIVTQAGYRAGVLKQRYGASELRAPWPHSLRHACAVHLLESGVPVNAVSGQLGHSKLQSTAVYLALADPDRERQISRVEF